MSRLGRVSDLYKASAQLATSDNRVEVVVVGDPVGGELDSAIRIANRLDAEDVPQLAELLAVARLVRWRNLVRPAPSRFDADKEEILHSAQRLALQLSALLDHTSSQVTNRLLAALTNAVDERLTPLGQLLLDSVGEVGPAACSVVTLDNRSSKAIGEWLGSSGLPARAVGVSKFMTAPVCELAYFLGPPAKFGSRVVTAPRAMEMSFLLPSWCSARALPRSGLSTYATGAVRPSAKTLSVGNAGASDPSDAESDVAYEPVAIWRTHTRREQVDSDDVVAHEVLLAGGMTIFLDQEGDLIRTLDPSEPPGHRVELRPVKSIQPGTFLVLREGETESDALLQMAYAELGGVGEGIRALQSVWKEKLEDQLHSLGTAESSRQLADRGVMASGQVRSWTRPTVVRPRADSDFVALLNWLGLNDQKHMQAANTLRRSRGLAVTKVTRALEDSLAAADMTPLESDGRLGVNLGLDGFAAMEALRVLAISPHEVLVPRSDVRILRVSEVHQWLE